MKKLIFVTLILVTQAFASPEIERILNQNNTKESIISELQKVSKTNKAARKFLQELDQFGLISPKAPVFEKAIKPELDKVKKEIISKLQSEIKGQYLDKLNAQWGECESGNCLGVISDVYTYSFQKKDICLPYTSCGFYKCMEEKYKCAPQGAKYFTELAYPTCSTYMRNINRNYFTKKGIEWIYTVMVCLQKGLVQECDIDGNCEKSTAKETCNHITKYTLEFHPSCYLESGVGVCKLPLKDKINVWRTVGKYLTSEETVQAFKVVAKCLFSKS